MEYGFINAYWEHKGFGFIRREKGKDVFFSIDDFLQSDDVEKIILKTNVSFELIKTAKGPKAVNLQLVKI